MAAKCGLCGKESDLISANLGFCVDCIRSRFPDLRDEVMELHALTRKQFGLPTSPPRDAQGVRCHICVNECQIGEGQRGFCGIRTNKGGKLIHLAGTSQSGIVHPYYDALPTNCVADWVCPAGSESGYPKFSYSQGPEYGYKNLAVFYGACSFDCLFCQNWHYRQQIDRGKRMSARELADRVDKRTACICYFGGDPTPQLPHAIRASRLALENSGDRVLRICWETNGTMSPVMLKQVAELSMKSGGCIKFDLKAYSEELNIALTCVTNRRTLENFRMLARMREQRPDPPFLIASTLLVPGYVDAEEVGNIAGFIASCGTDIPYSLLAFYPQFYMGDLPTTSRSHALECLEAARGNGLTNVHIGNLHLLSEERK
jgi:pyruvate formate lyase activating enzyme